MVQFGMATPKPAITIPCKPCNLYKSHREINRVISVLTGTILFIIRACTLPQLPLRCLLDNAHGISNEYGISFERSRQVLIQLETKCLFDFILLELMERARYPELFPGLQTSA